MLQSKIGRMPADELQFVHRLLLKVEAQKLWEELKAETAADRGQGRHDALNEVIAQVRADLAAGGA